MTLRFDGDMEGVDAANGTRVVVERGVMTFLAVAGALEEGGWFSASEDCGDWDGVLSIGGGVGDRNVCTILSAIGLATEGGASASPLT